MNRRILSQIAFAITATCCGPAAAQDVMWGTYIKAGNEAEARAEYAKAEKLYGAALREAEKFGPREIRLALALTPAAASPPKSIPNFRPIRIAIPGFDCFGCERKRFAKKTYRVGGKKGRKIARKHKLPKPSEDHFTRFATGIANSNVCYMRIEDGCVVEIEAWFNKFGKAQKLRKALAEACGVYGSDWRSFRRGVFKGEKNTRVKIEIKDLRRRVQKLPWIVMNLKMNDIDWYMHTRTMPDTLRRRMSLGMTTPEMTDRQRRIAAKCFDELYYKDSPQYALLKGKYTRAPDLIMGSDAQLAIGFALKMKRFHVFQVADDNNVIVYGIWTDNDSTEIRNRIEKVWISGWSTSQLLDDKTYILDSPVDIYIDGTKRYATALGSSNTIFHAVKYQRGLTKQQFREMIEEKFREAEDH